MSVDLFSENIKRRLFDITIQVKHASENKISNKARSGYYRAAIILACTIAEGLLFKIVKNHVAKNNNIIGTHIQYKYPHNIPSIYSEKEICLCIREEKNIILSTDTKFQELIRYSESNNLISKKESRKLDYVRKLRNKIHLQSLSSKDRGYTIARLEKVFIVVNFLLKKVYKL